MVTFMSCLLCLQENNPLAYGNRVWINHIALKEEKVSFSRKNSNPLIKSLYHLKYPGSYFVIDLWGISFVAYVLGVLERLVRRSNPACNLGVF
jgi:hypothetical protein